MWTMIKDFVQYSFPLLTLPCMWLGKAPPLRLCIDDREDELLVLLLVRLVLVLRPPGTCDPCCILDDELVRLDV